MTPQLTERSVLLRYSAFAFSFAGLSAEAKRENNLAKADERKLYGGTRPLTFCQMNQNYFTYILKCNNGTKYYGSTNNLYNRLKNHRNGHVRSTKNKRPVELIYYEEFETYSEAFRREMQFKNGKTRKETIEKLITNFSKAKCQGFNSH